MEHQKTYSQEEAFNESLKYFNGAALVGPAAVTAEGGMGGTYVRTLGRAGSARLTVSAPGVESAAVDFLIEV